MLAPRRSAFLQGESLKPVVFTVPLIGTGAAGNEHFTFLLRKAGQACVPMVASETEPQHQPDLSKLYRLLWHPQDGTRPI